MSDYLACAKQRITVLVFILTCASRISSVDILYFFTAAAASFATPPVASFAEQLLIKPLIKYKTETSVHPNDNARVSECKIKWPCMLTCTRTRAYQAQYSQPVDIEAITNHFATSGRLNFAVAMSFVVCRYCLRVFLIHAWKIIHEYM